MVCVGGVVCVRVRPVRSTSVVLFIAAQLMTYLFVSFAQIAGPPTLYEASANTHRTKTLRCRECCTKTREPAVSCFSLPSYLKTPRPISLKSIAVGNWTHI